MMNNCITLEHAITGYLLALEGRHRSPHTISDYKNTLRYFTDFIGADRIFSEITSKDIQSFLASRSGLSNKTILNYYTGISSMWSWAVDEDVASENVVRKLRPPRAEQREIIPFTQDEIRAMLGSLERSRPYTRPGKKLSDHAIPESDRSRAIILLLLDTGLRASELCSIHIGDVDNRNRRIHVIGKGARERSVAFSPRTGQLLWRYLASRNAKDCDDYLFTSVLNRPLTRYRLLDILRTIGKRAGIRNVHPHRFRHTFAIQYLRNGGDAYTLQAMLGHSSLDMVRTYLKLAQIDIDTVHRRASPVDNWRL
jgi:site-specific recombinase XerD